MSVKRDIVSDFFTYDIDFRSRTLWIGSKAYIDNEESGTDFMMAENAIKGLHFLDSGVGEITIIMNNPGGFVNHGMAIYDAVNLCKNFITIKVIGEASSMGSIILQAADKRIITKNSRMLVHYGYIGLEGRIEDVVRQAKQLEKDMKQTEEIYLNLIREKHPGYRRDKVKNMLRDEVELTADEALELNLVDEVL